jgi:hypothetical protein
MVKARDVFSFWDLDFLGAFFRDGVNFRAFFTSPRLKCNKKMFGITSKIFYNIKKQKEVLLPVFRFF